MTKLEILQKYRAGTKLDDNELQVLIGDMGLLCDIMSDYGDVFHTSYIYANAIRINCEKFLEARKKGVNK